MALDLPGKPYTELFNCVQYVLITTGKKKCLQCRKGTCACTTKRIEKAGKCLRKGETKRMIGRMGIGN